MILCRATILESSTNVTYISHKVVGKSEVQLWKANMHVQHYLYTRQYEDKRIEYINKKEGGNLDFALIFIFQMQRSIDTESLKTPVQCVFVQHYLQKSSFPKSQTRLYHRRSTIAIFN